MTPTSPLCSARPGTERVLFVICDVSVGLGGVEQQQSQQQQQRLQMQQTGQPAREMQTDQGAKGPLPWAQPAAAADHSNSSCLKTLPWEGPWKGQRSQAMGSEGKEGVCVCVRACLCACVCAANSHAMPPHRHVQETVLFFYHVGSRD